MGSCISSFHCVTEVSKGTHKSNLYSFKFNIFDMLKRQQNNLSKTLEHQCNRAYLCLTPSSQFYRIREVDNQEMTGMQSSDRSVGNLFKLDRSALERKGNCCHFYLFAEIIWSLNSHSNHFLCEYLFQCMKLKIENVLIWYDCGYSRCTVFVFTFMMSLNNVR